LLLDGHVPGIFGGLTKVRMTDSDSITEELVHMAKIYIVHDHEGKIISASESKNHGRPAHMTGLTQSEFEVPVKFKDKKMREYISLLKVDVAARHLKER